MRLCDAIAAFPSVLLGLVVIALIGSGRYNLIAALGILFIPSFARLVRGEFLKYRDRDFVRSARLMGVSDLRIIFVHILPNTWPVLLSGLTIGFNNAVLAEASMSYLGLGVSPQDASLGRMLSEAQSYLFTAPWYTIFPAAVMVLLILGVGMVGEGIRERMGEIV
jgi:peptide/nickel transport system permease protein